MEQTTNNQRQSTNKKMEEHERIELRSDDVQEIIGTPPRWIVRWGTFIICTALATLVGVSFYIDYPDKVIGRIKITSLTAPARIKIQQPGIIHELLVKDGDEVAKGDLLMVIQDAANYQDVTDLEDYIAPLQSASPGRLRGTTIEPITQQFELGSLQPFYSNYQTTLQEYQLFEGIGSDKKMILQLQRQIKDIKRSIENLQKQREVAIEQEGMAQTSYKKYEEMFEEEIIPREDVDKQYEYLLEKTKEVQRIEGQINEKGLEISNKGGEIEKYRNSGNQNSNENFIKLKTSINDLLGAINTWKQNFLIEAPLDGKVSMPINWSRQQFLEQGKEIMAIITSDSTDGKFIQFLIPIAGSGKVEPGQKVIIKFDNFRYKEFGTVAAEVIDVDELPRDNKLQVNIKLTDGLNAMKGKEIKFSQEMQGTGEIITAKRSVFTRIFENIIDPFRKDS